MDIRPKKHDVMLFAGTTEGREAARFLIEKKIPAVVYVATEYGKTSMLSGGFAESETFCIRAGKLLPDAMEEEMRRLEPPWVIDATHPFAEEVTRHIRECCERTGRRRLRLLRPEEEYREDDRHVRVSGKDEAVAYLSGTEGNILLTTGSKEVAGYAGIRGAKERLYVRVLPLVSSLEQCREAGIPPAHILALQGPFSRQMNEAMIMQYDIRYLVTKETGKEGGWPEKAGAAESSGCVLVSIRRPEEQDGMSLEEIKKEMGF